MHKAFISATQNPESSNCCALITSVNYFFNKMLTLTKVDHLGPNKDAVIVFFRLRCHFSSLVKVILFFLKGK